MKQKLNARELRKGKGQRGKLKERGEKGIYIILDDVLDTYNIGSIFRLADAVSAKKVILCGGTEIPPNHRIKKASINTTEWVEWEYFEDPLEAIQKLKKDIPKIQIIAIEQSTKSIPYDIYKYSMPLCLIVGNETYGVSEKVLEEVDQIVELPMFGVNISLNVMVSLGIVLYHAIANSLNKDDIRKNR